MTEALTDTHRRAQLRGRASLARWRIEGAAWVGWLHAASGVVALIGGAIGVGTRQPGEPWVMLFTAAYSAAMAWGIFRMRKGSLKAALAVTSIAALTTLPQWPPHLFGLVVVGVLANGAYGVHVLRRVERAQSDLPPAPEPRARFGRALG